VCFPCIPPWYAVLYRTRGPACGTGIQQPAQWYDIFQPDTVPAYFYFRDIRPAFRDAGWALMLAYCSPLTYFVDLFNAAMIGTSAFSSFVDGIVFIVVCAGYILAARIIQKRNRMKGM
jgi:ABC-type multidrug transport system permease subunit